MAVNDCARIRVAAMLGLNRLGHFGEFDDDVWVTGCTYYSLG